MASGELGPSCRRAIECWSVDISISCLVGGNSETRIFYEIFVNSLEHVRQVVSLLETPMSLCAQEIVSQPCPMRYRAPLGDVSP
jgi:hypothetical protein